MKILHTYCLNYNIGDYYLGIGLKNLLRKNMDVSLIGETNIQGREFNEYYINEVVNKRYDLLVIGGGGLIHGSHWPNGWFWLINKDLISKIRIPFIVYGVGYNYWEEEGGIPDRGIEHLSETFKYASYFSVRNDGSGTRIKNQTGLDVKVIPDPGFHVNLHSPTNRVLETKYVIIQLANDKPVKRFGSLEKRKIFIDRLRKITGTLAKKYKVVFTPHVYDDVWLSQEISKGINNVEIWDFQYFAFDHANESLNYYEHAEFVIAMRGHGQIIPISYNVPVISLENHPKHRGLMQELHLLDYNVKIDCPDLFDNLITAVNKVEANRILLKKRYQDINLKLREDSDQAFKDIKKGING